MCNNGPRGLSGIDNKIDCLGLRDMLIDSIDLGNNSHNKKAMFLQVGDRADSNSYIKGKTTLCEKKAINYEHKKYDVDITEEELIREIEFYNNSVDVMAIMLQLPLPGHLNEQRIIDVINPNKDLDGLTTINKGKLMVGDKSGIVPCTPLGIMTILSDIAFNVKGKNVVVIGRSDKVGKPMVQLLIDAGATVTCCNSNTPKEKVKELILSSNLFISAIDKPSYFDVEYFGEDNLAKLKKVIGIDVGIVRVNDKLQGNIAKELYPYLFAYTSVPGGVGPMTVASVVFNIAKCSLMK